MKVTGSAVLHAAPEAVYTALHDPVVLSGAIPGCESLTALDDNRYAMAVTAGVASIKGTYQGEVELTDIDRPGAFLMHATGSGTPGTVDATVRVTLADTGDGGTRLDYAADAAVGGMVGGVGQRMLTSVATKLAGQFFGNVDDVLTGRRPAIPPPPPTPGDHAIPARPVPGLHDHRVGGVGVSPIAAFVAGAAVALIGAAVGARIAGRR